MAWWLYLVCSSHSPNKLSAGKSPVRWAPQIQVITDFTQKWFASPEQRKKIDTNDIIYFHQGRLNKAKLFLKCMAFLSALLVARKYRRNLFWLAYYLLFRALNYELPTSLRILEVWRRGTTRYVLGTWRSGAWGLPLAILWSSRLYRFLMFVVVSEPQPQSYSFTRIKISFLFHASTSTTKVLIEIISC